MKIFLTGASGLVGGAFARAAAKLGHEIVGTLGGFSGAIEGLSGTVRIDLTEAVKLREIIRDYAPAAIVNAAGVSEPAKCEADPPRSHLLNVELPAQLAKAAQELGARLVHVSSEQVFDGAHPPYARTDRVCPINLYGRQKLESEERVHATVPDRAVTLRAPLLMGNSPSRRRSLHERLLADWAAGKVARVYADEFRQTCTAENLADAMVELCTRREICGVYHWAGSELLSRVELAQKLRTHFHLQAARAPVVEILRKDDPLAAAQRQANLALRLEPLSELLITPVQTFAEQLAQLVIPPELEAWTEDASR